MHETANLGITLVPEGRQLFPKMNVEENLIVGSYLKRAKENRQRNLERVYTLFPAWLSGATRPRRLFRGASSRWSPSAGG